MLLTLELEVPYVCVSHALDEVLLDASCSGDQHINHLVLHQPADLLTHTSADQVAGVAQVDLGAAGGPEGCLGMLRVRVGCDGVILKTPVDLHNKV